jgi:uncharacterized membrane protein
MASDQSHSAALPVTPPVTPADDPPLAAIAYYDDAVTSEPWARLVRLLGVAGLMMGGGDLLGIALEVFPIWGLQQRPFGLLRGMSGARMILAVAGWSVSILLTVGSVGCLARSRFARKTMIAYAVAGLAYAVLVGVIRPLLFSSSAAPAASYVYFAVSAVRLAAFPVVVLGVMRMSSVRRLFEPPSR